MLRAWPPLGAASIALILLAAPLSSPGLLVTGFVLGAIAGRIAFLVDLQHRTGLAWQAQRAARETLTPRLTSPLIRTSVVRRSGYQLDAC